MGKAKDIIVKPISAKDGNECCKRFHYSGKVVPNSQLHFGVFINGKLNGVMQFGPSMVKAGVIGLVKGTQWNNFLELNRMAFGPLLPKNSESRALAVAFRMIRKAYPHIDWIISFADGTQCGDGTIYRASGFVLTGIKANDTLRIDPETGKPIQGMAAFHKGKTKDFSSWERLKGFQLRYIYFLNPEARKRLSVPEIPFSRIDEVGAGMYRGKPKRASSVDSDTSEYHSEIGGASPTDALHNTGDK